MKFSRGVLASVLSLLVIFPCFGQNFLSRIVQPDHVGGNFVATRQDAAQRGSSGAGPGIEAFVSYNLTPSFFLVAATGISTITDKILTSENFRMTLLPTMELKAGYRVALGKKFSGMLLAGLHGFGWKTTTMTPDFTTDMYFDGGVIVGGGVQVAVNDQWSVQLTGDYRYIFTADDPKPQLWVAKAGLTYALNRIKPENRDEIEYPLGEGEVALDDLFREEQGDSTAEKDALALLFDSGENAEAIPMEENSASTSTETESIPPDTEIGQLMAKIQNLKNEMDRRNQQIEELQAQVLANEKTLAAVSSRMAGGYAKLSEGSFGVSSTERFKESYEQGLQTFYDKQYRDAVRIFSGLLATNPDHRLASNCQYWIGECHNALGEYKKAIDAFTAVMQFRSSFKFDDALLMTGLCYLKLGDRYTARENFQELISRYPESEYAPMAMRYLGSL